MAKTGKAAVMTQARAPLEIREYPLVDVEKGWILVKIKCCAICGSDLHTWLGSRPSPTPIILGHEIMGEVVELGTGVSRDSGGRPLKTGDRITWTIMDNCGKCYYCREKGLMMKCLDLKKYGHDSCASPPHFVGGFAEYCYVMPGTCVIKLPDELPDEVAASANCAVATVVAGWDAARLQPGDNVLIQGAGTLGIYAAALARSFGCNKIIVTDVMADRLNFIKRFGATDVVQVKGMKDEELVKLIQGMTRGFGVDVAMEVAGRPETIPVGLRCLRKGGQYIEQGNVFPGAHFSYDASDIIFRWLTIKGIHNYDTKHLEWAIDFLQRSQGIFPFSEIVTHCFALDQINAAMEMAHSGKAIRVVVKP
jgi:putative phosphonate catabolism associated alcohol dehydrogenase